MIQQDDLNIPMIITVGIVSVVLTIASVFAVQAMYNRQTQLEVSRKVVEVANKDAASRLAEQEASLARYRWVDRDRGVVAIPIERAMDLVVRQMATRSQP